MPGTPPTTIAFYLPQTGVFRDMVMGIFDYADQSKSFRVEGYFAEWMTWDELIRMGFDGMIYTVTRAGLPPRRLPPNLPAVNLSAVLEVNVPTVVGDNQAIGRMAAEHLLSCGFANFATVGRPMLAFSHARLHGFRQTIQRFGAACRILDEGLYELSLEEADACSTQAEKAEAHLASWLESLPKPVGVFAHDDTLGRHISKICEARGWDVPGQVGILSCDNDPMFCGQCHPQLSSVIYPGYAIGMQAAALLDRMLKGIPVDARTRIEIPPPGIHVRGSTDLAASRNTQVAKAVVYLRNNLQNELSVDDLARAAGMSRRSFERRFRQTYWMTPLELIRNERTRKARGLLAQTDLPMAHIAELSGFLSAQRMATVFKEITGMTPSDFRQHYKPRTKS